MAEVKTEQEPSIEEILESIRQIISEDTDEAEAKPVLDKLEAVPEAPIAPSDLSLAPKAEAPIAPSNLSLAPAPAAPAPAAVPLDLKPEPPAKPVSSSPPPLDLTDKVAPPVVKPAPAAAQPAPPAPTPPPAPSPVTIEMMDSPMTDNDKASGLVSPETASAVTDSLSKILASNVAVESEKSSPAGKVTLEDITRDLMKPMIKSWLDQHLPGIIEKAVQKEVEKLSRRVQDR